MKIIKNDVMIILFFFMFRLKIPFFSIFSRSRSRK